MLKRAKEKEIQILTVDDYIELFGYPNDNFGEDDQSLLYKLIQQATTQFDSLISTYGHVGSLYKWWLNLEDNDEDNSKGFRLQKAIGSWVETMIQNGKFWADGVPNMSSNISYDLNASSDNANIELKRKDIIQDLVSIGLTQTTNFGLSNKHHQHNINDKDIENLMVVSKDYLDNNFLMLNSAPYNQYIKSPVNFAENPIHNGGDISNTNINKHKIINYILQNCIVKVEDNNEIEAGRALTADKVLDTNDDTYKYINDFHISTWDGMTRDEIYNAITAGGVVWSPTILYRKEYVVIYLIKENLKKKKTTDLYGFAKSKVNDNIGHDPNDSPDYWEILPFAPTELNTILEYINQKIKELENKLTDEVIPEIVDDKLSKLPTIEYKSEALGEIISFDSEEDFENYKKQYGIDDTYFEDIEVESGGGSGNTTITFESQSTGIQRWLSKTKIFKQSESNKYLQFTRNSAQPYNLTINNVANSSATDFDFKLSSSSYYVISFAQTKSQLSSSGDNTYNIMHQFELSDEIKNQIYSTGSWKPIRVVDWVIMFDNHENTRPGKKNKYLNSCSISNDLCIYKTSLEPSMRDIPFYWGTIDCNLGGNGILPDEFNGVGFVLKYSTSDPLSDDDSVMRVKVVLEILNV